LIGHDSDVQDLGWACDSSILVSVGLDSKVVVWSGHTFEKLKTLSQHQSHVKGISFDPANKYFATASDDRTVKIYRFQPPDAKATAYDQVNNFVLEHTVSAPFQASPLTTYFRRLSWSPDGQLISAANAVNGPVSTVAVISRGTWDAQLSFVGHEGPVEVTTFSPRLYLTNPDLRNIKGTEAFVENIKQIVACAGQDRTLSIWRAPDSRPFAITQELAAKPISDLAWSNDGYNLFFASLDGTIAVCQFAEQELGYVSEMTQHAVILQKYGASRRTGIVENADALRLENSSKADDVRGVKGRMGDLMSDDKSPAKSANNPPPKQTNGTTTSDKTETVAAVANDKSSDVVMEDTVEPVPPPDPQAARVDKLKQRVTITKDGKKRIQPLLISSASGLAESSLPKSQLIVQNARTQQNDAPQNLLDVSKPYDGLPKAGLASLLFGQKRKFAEIEGDAEKRTEKRIQSMQQSGLTPILINTANGVVPPSLANPPLKEVSEVLRPAIVSPALTVSQLRLAVPLIRPSITRPLEFISKRGDQPVSNDESTTLLEVRNPTGPSRTGRPQDRTPARITLSRRGQIIWQDFTPKAVILTSGNRRYWVVACEDGSIHTWTPAGRRLLNALILDSQPVILDCRGWFLLAVTATGQCYVWNLRTSSSPHPPISLAPVLDIASAPQQSHLTPSPAIMFARLNSTGRIIVGTSNGDGFSYSPQLYIWQRLSEPWWAVGSQYWNTSSSSYPFTSSSTLLSSQTVNQRIPIDDVSMIPPSLRSSGLIPFLERNTTIHGLHKGRAFFLQRLVKSLLSAEGFEGLETAISVAHLENRIAAALTLGAREEFRLYLGMYVRRLGSEGLKGKVEELLTAIVGDGTALELPDDEADNDGDEDKGDDEGLWLGEDKEEICGWRRDVLLKEIILILGKNSMTTMKINMILIGVGKHRDLQRITVPYARLLGLLDHQIVEATEGCSVNGTSVEKQTIDDDTIMASFS